MDDNVMGRKIHSETLAFLWLIFIRRLPRRNLTSGSTKDWSHNEVHYEKALKLDTPITRSFNNDILKNSYDIRCYKEISTALCLLV